MNYWNIKQHGASVGDDFDAKMNYFKHIKCIFYIEWYGASDGDDFDAGMNNFKHNRRFSWTFSILNTAAQELEMILLLTRMYQIVFQCILITNRRIDA